MNCPTCGERMREVIKYEVQIDICPGCKGVWLDRGELEKIIEMMSGGRPLSGEPLHGRSLGPLDHDDHHERKHHDDHHERKHHDDDDDHKHDGHGYSHGRRKSWLSDLFD